ncbi:hypothetical protein P792_03145 [Asaia sp. SF2.1]|nr:hypothetical protein P792_03145 [Asaia sp. SF2.1]
MALDLLDFRFGFCRFLKIVQGVKTGFIHGQLLR